MGPRRAELLNKELGIRTVGDLLDYFPYKYVDRSRSYRIAEINGTMPYVQLYGQILSFESEGEGRGRRLVAHFGDGTGIVDLVWFQGAKYIAKTYDTRTPYVVFGKPQPTTDATTLLIPKSRSPTVPWPRWCAAAPSSSSSSTASRPPPAWSKSSFPPPTTHLLRPNRSTPHSPIRHSVRPTTPPSV